MKSTTPLVTIGIPTYNRVEMLRRSIKSALCQDYKMIEVIISNNASTDRTQDICQEFSKKDHRVTVVTQTYNIGATANFAEVLKRASGEYFMWLGDDDWLDTSYVSHCVSLLKADANLSLVSGAPIYYQHGLKSYSGRLFDLLEESWAARVARYYFMVTDNGMFYGIMHRKQLQQIFTTNAMGGDWHLIANIVSTGKCKMSTQVSVHRELGGATASYQQIAKSLGLPAYQATFPMTTIAFGAFKNIIISGSAYKKRNIYVRVILACVVFSLVIAKSTFGYLGKAKRFFKRTLSFLSI